MCPKKVTCKGSSETWLLFLCSCMRWHSPGGMWDPDDDCCERRSYNTKGLHAWLQNTESIQSTYRGHYRVHTEYLHCTCRVHTMCYLYILIRCTLDHPCTHGEGHCKSDSDCERSGYHICGATCIGFFSNNMLSYLFGSFGFFSNIMFKSYRSGSFGFFSNNMLSYCFGSGPTFDTKHFPNNTDIKYSPSDMCCVRRWKKFSPTLGLL